MSPSLSTPTLAGAWRMRPDNPASGFRRRIETERERFLTLDEIARLAKALTVAKDQRAAGIVRLCMLTGARLGEVQTARFEQFNLELAFCSKPATTVTRLMTEPQDPLPLAAAARRAARILGEDPGLASPRLAARMAGLLPSLALPEVMKVIRRAQKGHRSGPVAPTIQRALDTLLKSRHRPQALCWLDAAAGQALAGLPTSLGRVPEEAEVLSLLATLRPDPDRDGLRSVFPDPQTFRLEAQTIRYGYGVFGDPSAALNRRA
jgi:integrase